MYNFGKFSATEAICTFTLEYILNYIINSIFVYEPNVPQCNSHYFRKAKILDILAIVVSQVGMMYKYLWYDEFEFFRYIPKNETAGSYGILFLVFQNCQSGFWSSCTNLHGYYQGIRVPGSPPPFLLAFVVFVFLIAILTEMRLNLNVVSFAFP